MSEDPPLPTGLQLTSLDPVFREHPHEYLDRLRAQDPIHRDAELGRLFLTRFEDVMEVVSNRSLSVDPRKAPAGSYYRRAVIGTTPFEAFQPTMLHLDDPDHKRLRAIVTQAFNETSVDAFRPRIRQIAGALLDTLAGRDSFDVIAEYAAPLPIMVIAQMLGVDPADLEQLKRWSEPLTQILNPARTSGQQAELAAAQFGLSVYFQRAAEARRHQRGADLSGAIIGSRNGGGGGCAHLLTASQPMCRVRGGASSATFTPGAGFRKSWM
jgi:cytochrome P450